MNADDGGVLRPQSVGGGRWNVWLGKPDNDGVVGRSEYQDFEATATRPANCRVRENESKDHGHSLIAVREKSQMRTAREDSQYMTCPKPSSVVCR
jgi:hypothetical protein